MTIDEYNNSVALYSDGLFRFVLKNIGNYEKAEDIVQDVFEKFWVKKDNVDGQKVKSYLFTSAYHTTIDWIRKDKRLTSLEDDKVHEPSSDKQYSDLKEILDKAISKLPEVQRSVILLRDYEGYSYQEIAEMTGLNEPQVKVYIYRGRMFLKKMLVAPEAVV